MKVIYNCLKIGNRLFAQVELQVSEQQILQISVYFKLLRRKIGRNKRLYITDGIFKEYNFPFFFYYATNISMWSRNHTSEIYTKSDSRAIFIFKSLFGLKIACLQVLNKNLFSSPGCVTKSDNLVRWLKKQPSRFPLWWRFLAAFCSM
jgi:hypothetical protein